MAGILGDQLAPTGDPRFRTESWRTRAAKYKKGAKTDGT
jgi:hypothetical protein